MKTAITSETHGRVAEPMVAQQEANPAQSPEHQTVSASPQVGQLRAMSHIANGESTPVAQRQAAPQGGLPTNLKSGIEHLSGIAMNDVRVHYNSSKPAQLQAHAYAQGTDIHIAPGQERHLPHEAWHVVQQKQGRVKPTLQLKGVAINDDSALEREADEMGGRASSGVMSQGNAVASPVAASPVSQMQTVQRKVGFEFETALMLSTTPSAKRIPYGKDVFAGKNGKWVIKSDNSKVEFVTMPIETNREGFESAMKTMDEVIGMAHSLVQISQDATAANRLLANQSLGQPLPHEQEPVILDKQGITLDEIQAAPQASGGVTLDKIPALIDKILTTKLTHLKYSDTFEDIYAKPKKPALTGDLETDQLNLDSYGDSLLTHSALNAPVKSLNQMGYTINEPGITLGSASLLMMQNMALAKTKAQNMVDDVMGLDTEGAQKFQQTYGFSKDQFEAQTPRLRGLVTLILSYLYSGSQMGKPADYSKAIAPLMSRTNFYGLHQLLTPNEKKFFTVEDILSVSGLEDGPVYADGFYVYINKVKHTANGPKRSEWIHSIINGTDYTPEAQGSEIPQTQTLPFDNMSLGSRTSVGQSSSSMGAIQQPDINVHNANAAELAVLELRGLPKKQGVGDWKKTAQLIFEMFLDLNETDQEKADHMEKVRLKRLWDDRQKANSLPNAYRY